MHEHPNAAVVRRVYEAAVRGDRAVVAALVDPDLLGGDLRLRFGCIPWSISAVGELAVAIDRGPPVGDYGVSVFRVRDGRVVAARSVAADALLSGFNSPRPPGSAA